MTTSMPAGKSDARAWRVRDAAGWLGLAASPTFALMAWNAASDGTLAAICAAGPGVSSGGGMAGMYLLMSVFHLPPWLKLASGCRRRANSTAIQSEGA